MHQTQKLGMQTKMMGTLPPRQAGKAGSAQRSVLILRMVQYTPSPSCEDTTARDTMRKQYERIGIGSVGCRRTGSKKNRRRKEKQQETSDAKGLLRETAAADASAGNEERPGSWFAKLLPQALDEARDSDSEKSEPRYGNANWFMNSLGDVVAASDEDDGGPEGGGVSGDWFANAVPDYAENTVDDHQEEDSCHTRSARGGWFVNALSTSLNEQGDDSASEGGMFIRREASEIVHSDGSRESDAGMYLRRETPAPKSKQRRRTPHVKAQHEKRVDPADGMLYTFQEISNFYSGHYLARDIAVYWRRTCTRR